MNAARLIEAFTAEEHVMWCQLVRALTSQKARNLLATCALVALPGVAAAQRPDSSSGSPEGAVYRVWNAYIASKQGRFAANAGARSTFWLSAEQKRWPMYDLAGFYIPDGAVNEVESIRKTGRADEYELVARFRRAGEPDSSAITVTVFGVRERGRWVLANALPRKTAHWQRYVVGPIIYFVDPRLQFSRSRARQALAFVDSLAQAFALPRLSPTDYYVASSVDTAMEILGVKTMHRYGAAGGFSKPVNHQIFSGIPAEGENYRHELVHLVLRPLFNGSTTTLLASEGVATWLGGTGGTDFRGSVRALEKFLIENPAVTLDSILNQASSPQSVRYTAGAVLCEMLARHGGARSIAAFHSAGPGSAQVRAAIVRVLGRTWPVRAIACFDQALGDVGLAEDDPLRRELLDYFTWATTSTMSRYPRSRDDVPDGMLIPKWSWHGLVTD
jgi:hypothetical protein